MTLVGQDDLGYLATLLVQANLRGTGTATHGDTRA